MTPRWRPLLRAARTAPLLCLLAACATTGGRDGTAPALPVTVPAPVTLDRPPSLVVEVIVTDTKGAPAEDLRVTDFGFCQSAVISSNRLGWMDADIFSSCLPFRGVMTMAVTFTPPVDALS